MNNLLPALTLALSGAVVAVAAPAPDMASDFRAPLPQVESHDGVEVLNGGASLGEASYMKQKARDFPLQLLFSGKGGEYGVADRVTVRQGNEEIVSVPDAGPYLLLDVPPGRYTVEAEFDGAVEQRSVAVNQDGPKTVYWNTPKASD